MSWGPQSTGFFKLGVSRRPMRGAFRRFIRKILSGAAEILTPQGNNGVLVPILVPVRQTARRRR